MIRRVWDSLPEFRYSNDAYACADYIKVYFKVQPAVRAVDICFALTLPDEIEGDLRIQIETFIVAWAQGNEHGHLPKSAARFGEP